MKTPHHITSLDELRSTITQMDLNHKAQGLALKAHGKDTLERLKPVNLIKGALHDISESSEVKTSLIVTGVGFILGHIVKAIVKRGDDTPLKNVVGSALQMGVTGFIANHPEEVKGAGSKVIAFLGGVFGEKEVAA